MSRNFSPPAQLKNGPKSPRRKRGILSISLHKHQHHHASSDKLNPAPVITAAPYDWRISPRHLEARDGYFSDLKRKIECLYKSALILLCFPLFCEGTRNVVIVALKNPPQFISVVAEWYDSFHSHPTLGMYCVGTAVLSFCWHTPWAAW